jgi:hypothetical protein
VVKDRDLRVAFAVKFPVNINFHDARAGNLVKAGVQRKREFA